MDTAFFLGANTPGGFVSFFNEWPGLDRLKRLYIIKGTPGNGKSGFMRRIAGRLREKGYGHEMIMCSADPDSLDGIYFPQLGIAFADGTPPHAIEPAYPLAVECYLPLTQFVDDAALVRERASVIELKDGIKKDYTRLTRVLSAVNSLREERQAAVLNGEALETIHRRARGIIRREIRKGTGGLPHRRFLHAIGPSGETVLWDTVNSMADRVYELQDGYRLSHILLQPVLEAAIAAGQEAYACYDPCAKPGRLSHLILPGLRLAFTGLPYPGKPYRRIRLDAAVSKETARRHRLRLRFLRKTEAALMEDACGIMGDAVNKHSRLEELYNPHADFTGIRALADAYADKVLQE